MDTNLDIFQPVQADGLEGYTVNPVFTIGESIDDYTPVGILDGIGAFELNDQTVRIFVNHELTPEEGYAYQLENSTELTGARISYFDIDKASRAVKDAGLAYDKIINRAGEIVDDASDLDFEGLNRLCSAQYIEAGQFGEGRGLIDSLFFTGEESSGGTEFVLNPKTNTLHAVPWLGRAAWENVTELDTGTTDKVALLVGDDREGAPLTLYVGNKDTSKDASILERNGLVGGQLYVWATDSGETTPEEFNGTSENRSGKWVEIPFYDLEQAGTAVDSNADGDIQDDLGYDAQGFATQAQQDALAEAAGAFRFSRPEDVATNPEDGTQAVLASTGRDSLFPSDSWGTTYTIDTDFGADGTPGTAAVNVIYDGDDAGAGQFEGSDFGLRSPDNLDWADDGNIYIQEDRSFDDFGLTSGEETSIWKLDPNSGALTRVAQIDREALPLGQTDSEPTDIGNWETSGILDVSELFDEDPGDLLLFDVQAHSLEDGVIGDENLVEGGQLAFLEAPELESLNEIISTKDIDTLIGTAEADAIQGLGGDDTIRGLLGDDRLEGGAGRDNIKGGAGHDTLDGGEDNDILLGKRGDDLLLGGTGRDRITGGRGEDTLIGGADRDGLTGGIGADAFVLEVGQGEDTICDYQVGQDTLGLAEGLTVEQLGVSVRAENTFIQLLETGQNLAVLDGVTANQEDLIFETFSVVI